MLLSFFHCVTGTITILCMLLCACTVVSPCACAVVIHLYYLVTSLPVCTHNDDESRVL